MLYSFLLSLIMLITVLQPAAATDIQDTMIHYIAQQKQSQLALLERLVNINSGTANAEGVRNTGTVLKQELEALGFDVQWHDLPAEMRHAGSLVATHRGKSKMPRFLLIGHLDTVFGKSDSFQKFVLSDDGKYATGPGVIDAKGGIVTILYAMKALKAVNALENASITIVLTGDEELAARPVAIARKALTDAAKQSDIALGFEFALAPDELVVTRRGLSEWVLTSTGKAAHSSQLFQPDVGSGAVYETARVVDALRMQLASLPGVTINAGILLGGQQVTEDGEQGTGAAHGRKTIVPALVIARGDLRYSTPQEHDRAETMFQTIAGQSLPETHSSVEFTDIIPAMPATRPNEQLLEDYSAVSQALGGPVLKAVSPLDRGGADISHVTASTKAAIDGLGPWGQGAHTGTETLDTASLTIATQRTALFLYEKTRH
jgi:glutamate carboxypeptidase